MPDPTIPNTTLGTTPLYRLPTPNPPSAPPAPEAQRAAPWNDAPLPPPANNDNTAATPPTNRATPAPDAPRGRNFGVRAR